MNDDKEETLQPSRLLSLIDERQGRYSQVKEFCKILFSFRFLTLYAARLFATKFINANQGGGS